MGLIVSRCTSRICLRFHPLQDLQDLFSLNDYIEVCSFVDDTTLIFCDKDLSFLNRLEHDSS